MPVAIRTSCIRELDEKDQMRTRWVMEYRELDIVKRAEGGGNEEGREETVAW